MDKDAKEARDRRIFDMWLACYSQEEIGKVENVDHKTVGNVLGEFVDLQKFPKPQKVAAEYADFEPPLYNIWKQQKKTEGSSHFGNSEVRWLDNLLYLYTSPFDVVVATAARVSDWSRF